MELQELINQSNLNMTLPQIKAFLLGVLSADRPLPYQKALEELLLEAPGSEKELGPELKKLWDNLCLNRNKELSALLEEKPDLRLYLEFGREQLDYFLTGMTLSGTDPESCENDELAELIDELEDTVMDLDDYLSGEELDETAEQLKKHLLDVWYEFIEIRQ